MAKATTNKRSKVEQRVTITDEIVYYDEINLTMTAEEAQMVADVLANVGGSPTRTRRALSQNVQDALDKIGFCSRISPDIEGSIYFRGVEK